MKTRILRPLCLALLIGGALTASAVNVTFRVNMSVQIAMGQFNPANDYVTVGANFNGWSETAFYLAQSPADTNIWEGAVDLVAGSWPNYKFIKLRSGFPGQWEVNGVGAGGARDRWFQVPAADSSLEVVYFNNLTEVVKNHAPVTFQVDMSVQIAQGAFIPGSSTLAVSGDAIDAWANLGDHLLAQSPGNTNLWIATFEITNNVGSAILYKFIMDGAWESIDNRSFTMTNQAQTLPVVFFNNITNAAVPIPTTFRVNMGVALARGTFSPGAGDIVEARGSFLTGPGGWLGGFTLTNDAANPIVYSGTYPITNSPGGNVLYKFVISGSTWEGPDNRTYVFSSTNAVQLPNTYFNNVASLGPLTNTPVSATSADLSWSGGPLIRVQTSTNLTGIWQDVPGSEAQSSTTVTVGTNQTYFRLIGP